MLKLIVGIVRVFVLGCGAASVDYDDPRDFVRVVVMVVLPA